MKLEDLGIELLESIEPLEEAVMRRQRAIRKGRMVRRRYCPKGFRLVGRRCVKQSATERQRRKLGAKRGNRKNKAARKRSRMRSMRIRRARRL